MKNESTDIIVTLHPKGSANDVQIPVERRKLVRPEISYWKVSLNVLIPLLVCMGMCTWDTRFSILILCAYVLFRLRRIAIWCVRFYQRYAPDEVRLVCGVKPSCSEYMILSIEKYGIVRGIIKGVKRLKRCHILDGCEDYP